MKKLYKIQQKKKNYFFDDLFKIVFLSTLYVYERFKNVGAKENILKVVNVLSNNGLKIW